ncbi:TMV resistance protein N [Glycine soja]
MSRIEKSTIARAVHNLIFSHFEGMCFLPDIRDKAIINMALSNSKKCYFLKYSRRKISKWEMHEREYDGSGSIIIITTRDKHLLATHGVVKLYEVKPLNVEKSFELFNWHAFKNKIKVDRCYLNISNRAVLYIYVTQMLHAHGFHPEDSLRVLVDRSLIKINASSFVRMHDFIQDTGREIVTQESKVEPAWQTLELLSFTNNVIQVCSSNLLMLSDFHLLFKELGRDRNWWYCRCRKSSMHFWFRNKFPKIALCCSIMPGLKNKKSHASSSMVMPLSNSLLHLTTYLKHGIQYVSVIYNVAEIFFEKKYPTQSSRTVMTTHNFARVCLHCTLIGVYEEGNNKEDIEFKNQMSTFSFPSTEHLSVLPSCLYYVVSDGAE